MKLVDAASKTPKYRQIVENVTAFVRRGVLKKGDKLPSINALCRECGVSRDTAVKAFALLKKTRLIDSVHGKEFYILADAPATGRRTLLLLDEMNLYKRRIVDGLRAGLGETDQLDVFLHNQNDSAFETLFATYHDKFDDIVVIPTFDRGKTLSFLLRHASKHVVVLDRALGDPRFPTVHQDFENGTYGSLFSGIDLVRKYRKLNLIRMEDNHIVNEIRRGAERFCAAAGVEFGVSRAVEPRRAESYLFASDELLVRLVQAAKTAGLVIGKDVGVISYNDTPLKEVVADGITVISTDFEAMGRAAAALVISGATRSCLIETRLIVRSSL